MNIRQRVTLWVTGAGLCTSALFSLVVFWEMREQPYDILDTQLNTTVGLLVDLLAERKDGTDEAALLAPISGASALWLCVYDQALHPVYQSPLARLVALPPPTSIPDHPYTVATRGAYRPVIDFVTGQPHESYRVRARQVDLAGVPRVIQVGIPIEKLHEELFDLLVVLGGGLAVSSIMLLAISFFLAGRIVQPVHSMMRHVRQCNEETLERHLPLSGRRDELNALCADLNRMFDRLRYSFIRQKQYLAAVSHELKTPLAILRLFFDEAEQRVDLPADFCVTLRRQGRNVLRLDRMVRSLLELSALEASGSMQWEQLDLTELIRSVLEDFAPLTSHRHLRLTTHLQEAVVLEGDRDKLRRLLINILDNAVRYNDDNGWLELTLAAHDDWVVLVLANGGRGIPSGELERVFDQFHRVEKSRSQSHGGVGLGLAIVREIVRLHRGSVAMNSQATAWTRITVELPQCRNYSEGTSSRDTQV
ncbi:MAG: hypothetical protein BWK76_16225 [Desulfobulbaceae bacterium A2]|nr:MAG: hypothetical protein BWK76_16225 [Desulfobulbaceae bacterium A2]